MLGVAKKLVKSVVRLWWLTFGIKIKIPPLDSQTTKDQILVSTNLRVEQAEHG